MTDLGGLDRASHDEGEAAIWAAYKATPTSDLRDSLFARYEPVARRLAARRFGSRGRNDIEFEDLCQLAYAGLLESIDRFDPQNGAPFRAYAVRRIDGSILDGLAKMSEVREQSAFRKRFRAERVSSLSGHDLENFSAVEALQALVDLVEGLAVGLMLEAGAVDQIPDRRPTAYESLAWKRILQDVSEAMATLPERDRLILRRHYLESIPFEQLSQELRLSRGRISQIHRSALSKLRVKLAPPEPFDLQR